MTTPFDAEVVPGERPLHAFDGALVGIFVALVRRDTAVEQSTVPARFGPTIDAMTDELPEAPRWQGINHLALVTPDMDATVRFYVGVLGMRLAATTMAGPMRHYFFEMDRGNTVAFFEIEGAETFAKPAGGPSDRAIQLDHISFDVPD